MTKISFDFGIGLDLDSNPISPDSARAAITALVEKLSRLTGGCSAYERLGGWQDGENLVLERGITLSTVVAAEKRSEIRPLVVDMADAIKSLLRQQCVAVTVESVDFELL